MLGFFMLIVVMPSAIFLNVVAPTEVHYIFFFSAFRIQLFQMNKKRFPFADFKGSAAFWLKTIWPKDIWSKDIWLKDIWPKDI